MTDGTYVYAAPFPPVGAPSAPPWGVRPGTGAAPDLAQQMAADPEFMRLLAEGEKAVDEGRVRSAEVVRLELELRDAERRAERAEETAHALALTLLEVVTRRGT